MSVETDLQRDIKKSVIRQGGYAIKLSNRFTIGVPDLLIALTPFVPCYVEVKKFGKCAAKFDRELGVTPKQRHELRSFGSQYAGPVSFIFVGVEWGGEHWLSALYYNALRVDYTWLQSTDSKVPRQTGNFYDVAHLLKTMGAGRMA